MHVFELNVAVDFGQRDGAVAVEHFGLLVHDVHDLVERRRCRQERVVELGELLDRIEEVLHVEHEGKERSQRDVTVEVQVAAVAENDGERDRREQVDKREVEPVQDDGLHVRISVALRDDLEVARVRLLAREGLHDAHARDVLGERRSHEPQAFAHRAIGARRANAEDDGRDAHQRDHGEGRQGEPPVEDEEQDRRADQRQAVLDEARDAVGDELVDRLDVVRQAADDHAGARALVEAERKPLQMAKEADAQVGQDAFADPAGEIRLHVAHRPVEQSRQHERADDPPELAEVVLADAVVDCVLRKERWCQRSRGRRQQRNDREHRPRAIRPGQPRERSDAPPRASPGPVVDLDLLDRAEVAARLPDPHEPRPLRRPSWVHARAAPPGWGVLDPPATRGRRYRRSATCSRRLRADFAQRRHEAASSASVSARASTASANWRSSRPWS